MYEQSKNCRVRVEVIITMNGVVANPELLALVAYVHLPKQVKLKKKKKKWPIMTLPISNAIF